MHKPVSKPDSKTAKEMAENLPTFGFEQDHVISEKTDSFRKHDRKKSPAMSEEETENIEDSFLNPPWVPELINRDDLYLIALNKF